MKCPTCGGQRMRIGVVFSGTVACEFQSNDSFEVYEAPALDSHWDSGSQCQCDTCGWLGCVADAQDIASEGDLGAEVGLDLDALEVDVEQGRCPPEIAESVVKLVRAVRKLRGQVRMLERVNEVISRGNSIDSGDTGLF